MKKFLPVNTPLVNGNEKKYILEALDTGWLALDHPVMNKEVFYQSRSTRVNLQNFNIGVTFIA